MKKLFMLTVLVTGLAFASKAHVPTPDVGISITVDDGLHSTTAAFLADKAFGLNVPEVILVGIDRHEDFAYLFSACKVSDANMISLENDERPGYVNAKVKAVALEDVFLLQAEMSRKQVTALQERLHDFAFCDEPQGNNQYRSIYPMPENTRTTYFKGFAYPPALRSRSTI